MNRTRPIGSIAGFTLVELTVSLTVLGVLLLLLTQLINALHQAIAQTTSGIQEFRDARTAFETMTRRISQATLNAYDDLNPVSSAGNLTAASYSRASELRFVSGDAGSLMASSAYPNNAYPNAGTTYPNKPYCPTDAIFFQAPLGFSQNQNASLAQLLNTCGYYIQWGSDATLRPSFLPASVPLRYRFRLLELLEPSENLSIYSYTSGPSTQNPSASNSWYYFGWDWFQTSLNQTNPKIHVLAENVIFLALLPMVAPQNAQFPAGGDVDGTSTDIAPNYYYDSSPPNKNYQPVFSSAGQNALVAPYPQNQLPPLVYVMTIAVDDVAFGRYEAGNGVSSPTNLGLSGILTNSTYASRVSDVAQVTTILNTHKIPYRVFSAAVPLSRN